MKSNPSFSLSLGSWPIKVGSKTIQQQVMLVENAFFPVILGRSFMEKRGVKTDPLDQTSITFMDSQSLFPLLFWKNLFPEADGVLIIFPAGEVIPTDVVVVKDVNGAAIPVS